MAEEQSGAEALYEVAARLLRFKERQIATSMFESDEAWAEWKVMVERMTMPRPSVSGRVQVFCGHGVEKRLSEKKVELDLGRAEADFCLCCSNLYAKPRGAGAGKCPDCLGPMGVAA